MRRITKAEALPIMRDFFDRGALAAQTEQNETREGCLYRNRAGRPCIVGCLLTDDEAAKIKASGRNGGQWSNWGPGLSAGVELVEVDWFLDAQLMHDKVTLSGKSMRAENLRYLAAFLELGQ